MSKNFFVIGGDLRVVKLVKILADKNVVYTYGLEKSKEIDGNENIIKCKKIDEEVLYKNKIVIGPIPFSKDGSNIYAPYKDNEIEIKEVFKRIRGKQLIAGSIKDEIYKIAKEDDIKITDLLQNEKLAILNCISTAEGAIEIAIRETDRIIHGSNILVLGFGRIGKVLSKKLQGLSVNVTCAARKQEDLAWIKAYGFNEIDINDMREKLSKFDIIFNTVPHQILTKDKFDYINPNCTIIELATPPGGIDRTAADEKNIKVIDALALPGKVAPTTTAKFMKDLIFEIINDKQRKEK